MIGRRVLVPIALGLALWLCLSWRGASTQPSVAGSLRIRDVFPRDLEVGDKIAILGDGFPAGAAARVVFRGTLRRPGEAERRDAEVVLRGVAARADEVDVDFGEAERAAFADGPEKAPHTAFEGDVEVAFAAPAPGAPPLSGTLSSVELDVRPDVTGLFVEDEREGARTLAWLGLQGAVHPAGWVVDAVEPASRAEQAGFVPGDLIESFDGVRVLSLADFAVRPGERTASARARSGSAPSVVRALPVYGLRGAPASEVLGAAAWVLGALGALFFWCAPVPLGMGAFFLRWSQRAGFGRAKRAARPRAAGSGKRLVSTEMAVAVGVGALVLSPSDSSGRLGVEMLFLPAAIALAVAAAGARRGAWARVSAGLRALALHVPAALAVASIVAATGSVRVLEIVRAQGGWPWSWLGFRQPASLLSLGLLLSCAVLDVLPGSSAASSKSSTGDATGQTPAWVQATMDMHRVTTAILAGTLFLGGWLLPGWTEATQRTHPALVWAGGAWLFAKSFVMLGVMGAARRAVEARDDGAIWLLLPAALVAFGASALWTWWSPPPPTQFAVSAGLVVFLGFAGLAALERMGFAAKRAPGGPRLSPFL